MAKLTDRQRLELIDELRADMAALCAGANPKGPPKPDPSTKKRPAKNGK